MEQLWYVVGFAFAGVSFVFLTIAAAWLVSHRNRGDVHKGLPYESSPGRRCGFHLAIFPRALHCSKSNKGG